MPEMPILIKESFAPLIRFTNKGLYCPRAGVYIDPTRRVKTAIITHGHSDHAKAGHSHYLCHKSSVPILKIRLGNKISIQGVNYAETINCNGVKISLHPAGHILGSSQIRLEFRDQIWIITGDYKLENDGISGEFESQRCTHMISECTFGLPLFQWEKQENIFHNMNNWLEQNRRNHRLSLLSAYSLGKVQRILAGIVPDIVEIYAHPAILDMNKAYQAEGVKLPNCRSLNDLKLNQLRGSALILASPAQFYKIIKPLNLEVSLAQASGWLSLQRFRKFGNLDKSFVLSDHCDWNDLNEAIQMSGAHSVYPTHGYTDSFSYWLKSKGIHSTPIGNPGEREEDY